MKHPSSRHRLIFYVMLTFGHHGWWRDDWMLDVWVRIFVHVFHELIDSMCKKWWVFHAYIRFITYLNWTALTPERYNQIIESNDNRQGDSGTYDYLQERKHILGLLCLCVISHRPTFTISMTKSTNSFSTSNLSHGSKRVSIEVGSKPFRDPLGIRCKLLIKLSNFTKMHYLIIQNRAMIRRKISTPLW